MSTRTAASGWVMVRLVSTVVPAARVPACTPPGGLISCRPPGPSPRYSQSPIAVGSSAEAVNRTAPPSTLRISRTCRCGGVTAAPAPPASSSGVPTSSRRAPSESAAQTIRPSPVRAGTPGTMSSQRGSVSSRSTAVAPVDGSAVSSRMTRWSRLCTTISGSPPASQATSTRYGNAAQSMSTSARRPSRPASRSETSALGVPAAG